ncbi:hypothetical protein PDJ90_24740 [Bacillus cereus]|nr:hypothetical protein [Bacillus cereus]
MNVQLQGNEQITKLFNDWYRIILQHQTIEATKRSRAISRYSFRRRKIEVESDFK